MFCMPTIKYFVIVFLAIMWREGGLDRDPMLIKSQVKELWKLIIFTFFYFLL